nr:RNA-directed DNA polymerase, eukaryota, reverse transcriptase zinc-binding domain protein [Tanacetum cinerariifolium]
TNAKELWRFGNQYGNVIDAFIRDRRSKIGKRFGFIRFIKVADVDRLIKNLCTIWIGKFKLHANFTRFNRLPLNKGIQYVAPTAKVRIPSVQTFNRGGAHGTSNSYIQAFKTGSSYKAVVEESKPSMVLDHSCYNNFDSSLSLVGKLKDIGSLPNIKKILEEEGTSRELFADLLANPGKQSLQGVLNSRRKTNAKELWRFGNQYGNVIDAFIRDRRSKIGKRFGFIRFIKVADVDRLIKNLCTIWIGKFKLHANFTRFNRLPLNKGIQYVAPTAKVRIPSVQTFNRGGAHGTSNSYIQAFKTGSSYKAVVEESKPSMVLDHSCYNNFDSSLSLVGKLKDIGSLPNIKKILEEEGFVDITICYMGGFWVLFQFISQAWLGLILKEFLFVFGLGIRLIKFPLNGVLCCMKRRKMILIFTGSVCVSKLPLAITEWAPKFSDNQDVFSDSDVSSEDVNDDALSENGKEDSHSEADIIHETVFEEGEVKSSDIKEKSNEVQQEAQSEDPFKIYDLLKSKHPVFNVARQSEDEPMYPPGFTPCDNSANIDSSFYGAKIHQKESSKKENGSKTCFKKDVNASVCSGHFKKVGSPKSGGSILQQIEDLIKETKIEQVSVFDIKSCWDYFIAIMGKWLPIDRNLLIISIYAPQGDVIVMGDFNEVRFAKERFETIFNARGATIFNSFITSGGLVEVPTDKGEATSAMLDERLNIMNDLTSLENNVSLELVQKAKIKWAIEWIDSIVHTFSMEEVKGAVWGCGLNKSPMVSLLNFIVGCNSSFIALIQKFPGAKMVKDFRPISLIGSLYRIIAKLLATRLVTVMSDLVNEVQSAFIANRQILDGPFRLNEIIHWCKSKKKQTMIFKVDFEKAFDSVRWDFLDDVMANFGFGTHWSDWILSCLKSPRGFILVNGSPTLEFQFYKGLKQGDPLSSFLFILVMESLNLSLHNVVSAGLFKRVNLDNSLQLSYLFYADDVVFSKLIGIDVDQPMVEAATSNIGCMALNLPFSYLGIIIGGNMSRIKAWDDVINKVLCRLSKWKIKILSICGRFTLLKFVLGASPIYFMSMFNAPIQVLKKLESIRNHFFNGVDSNVRKMMLIKWDNALASKEKGGLGVSSFYALNCALTFKWIWRFRTQGSSLWSRVIKLIHGEDGKVGKSFKHGLMSNWNSITRGITLLQNKGIDLLGYIKKKTENGENSLFWGEV